MLNLKKKLNTYLEMLKLDQKKTKEIFKIFWPNSKIPFKLNKKNKKI